MNYKVQVKDLKEGSVPYILELSTDDIEWSMSQYQRNRPPLSYKVIEINGSIQTDNSSSL